MLIRKLSCCALLASLAGCHGPSARDVDPPPPSSVSFQYSGVGRHPPGIYRAVGDVDPRIRGAQPGNWAYGSMSGHAAPRVHVESSRRHAGGGFGFDGAAVYLPSGVRTGQTLPFEQSCETSPSCAGMTIELGLYPNVGFPEIRCTMTLGACTLPA